MLTRLFFVFLLTAGLFADSDTTRIRPKFDKQIHQSGAVVVPNSNTAVTATDSVVYQVVIANVTGSAATFTMTNAAGTRKLFTAVSIAANTTAIANFPEGYMFTGGISWSSGTADAIHAEIAGFYR